MRIKKYENWKLNIINPPIHKINDPQINKQSFSISQLLETPKKSINNKQHDSNPHHNQNHIQQKYTLTNPQITTNLNHRSLHKTDIYLNNKNIKSNKIFPTQQTTQREQIIKYKIKQRIKQQYVIDNFYIKTNRSFFGNNNNNNCKDKRISMQLSFDQRLNSKCLDNIKNNKSVVHIKGKSLPISQFTHKRSKSTIIRAGLATSTQKQRLFKTQKHNNNQFIHSKKRVNSVDMKRQYSLSLSIQQKLQQKNQKVGNKTVLKDIKPWQFDAEPQTFDII